jgi:hypothetical protein
VSHYQGPRLEFCEPHQAMITHHGYWILIQQGRFIFHMDKMWQQLQKHVTGNSCHLLSCSLASRHEISCSSRWVRSAVQSECPLLYRSSGLQIVVRTKYFWNNTKQVLEMARMIQWTTNDHYISKILTPCHNTLSSTSITWKASS